MQVVQRLKLVLWMLLLAPAWHPVVADTARDSRPILPFRIVANVYYVGASDVACYLLVTAAGLLLLDGGHADTAEQIERNIDTLGFRITDVKILLNGHAHPDHAGGLARLKRDSGARFEAMDAEVRALQNEGRGTFYRGPRHLFDSIVVDRVLHDGSEVALGGVRLTAHRSAGHTPGCTTWTMQVTEERALRDVVFACQLTVPEDLLSNPWYPGAAADFERTFQLLRTLPCDVLLGEHGSAFDLQRKLFARAQDQTHNPFVDAPDCERHIDAAARAFSAELEREKHLERP